MIPKEYVDVKLRVDSFVRESKAVTISTDGWTDINQRTILNFIIHTPEPRRYYFMDVTADGETGEVVAKAFLKIIEEIGAEKVAGLVTDHAAVMKKSWRLVKEVYPWILGEGCKAHALNLVMRDIFECGLYEEYVKSCAEMVKFFK